MANIIVPTSSRTTGETRAERRRREEEEQERRRRRMMPSKPVYQDKRRPFRYADLPADPGFYTQEQLLDDPRGAGILLRPSTGMDINQPGQRVGKLGKLERATAPILAPGKMLFGGAHQSVIEPSEATLTAPVWPMPGDEFLDPTIPGSIKYEHQKAPMWARGAMEPEGIGLISSPEGWKRAWEQFKTMRPAFTGGREGFSPFPLGPGLSEQQKEARSTEEEIAGAMGLMTAPILTVPGVPQKLGRAAQIAREAYLAKTMAPLPGRGSRIPPQLGKFTPSGPIIRPADQPLPVSPLTQLRAQQVIDYPVNLNTLPKSAIEHKGYAAYGGSVGEEVKTGGSIVIEAHHGTYMGKGKLGTPEDPFGEFTGIHFGTRKASADRLENIPYSKKFYDDDVQDIPEPDIFPVSIRLNKTYGTVRNPVSEEEVDKILRTPGTVMGTRRSSELIDQGYDGIIYRNSSEDPGSISVLVFNRSSVNKLPKTIDDITESRRIQKPDLDEQSLGKPYAIRKPEAQLADDNARIAKEIKAAKTRAAPTAPARGIPPTAPVAERILPESVVTGMREGRSAKALPSVDSLQDNYRKPLSGYTDRLFHETSIDSARGFLLRGNSNKQDIFFANSADMARGQGGTGVLIEFDPGLIGREIEGQINRQKPTWEFSFNQGDAEFVSRFHSPEELMPNVVSFTIAKDAQSGKGPAMAIQNIIKRDGWVRKNNPDGSRTYTKPTPEPTTAPVRGVPPTAPAARDVAPEVAKETGQVRFASTMSSGGTVEAGLRPGSAVSVHTSELSPARVKAYNDAFGTNYTPKNIADNASLRALKASQAEHYHASPVCKHFTAANHITTADPNDLAIARSVARDIREANPPTVSIENVPLYGGFYPRKGGIWVQKEDEVTALYKLITKELDDGGYNWDVIIVNAADHGAAQSRNRLIVRAVRKDVGELPPAPQKTHNFSETGQGEDWYLLLEDLVRAEGKGKPLLEEFTSRKPGEINDEIKRIQRYIGLGKLNTKSPIIAMGESASKDVPSASNAGGPAPTLLASERSVVRIIFPGAKGLEDATAIRVTPRMMNRLMGLPESYVLPSSRNLAKNILGDGVHGAITRDFIQPLVDIHRAAPSRAVPTTAPVRAGGIPPSEPPPRLPPWPTEEFFPPTVLSAEEKMMRIIPLVKAGRAETERLHKLEYKRRAGMAYGVSGEARRKRLGTEATLAQVRASQRGPLPTAELNIPKELQFTPDDLEGMRERLWKVWVDEENMPLAAANYHTAFNNLVLNNQIPTKGEIAGLSRVFGDEFMQAMLDTRKLGEKAFDEFLAAINLPRAVLTSIDLSAPLRQGAIIGMGHPLIGLKALGPMVKAIFSDKWAYEIDDILRADPSFLRANKAGMHHVPIRPTGVSISALKEARADALEEVAPGVSVRDPQGRLSSALSERAGRAEEYAFSPREKTLVAKVVRTIGLGIPIRASERAFVTFLNVLRQNSFKHIMQRWEEKAFRDAGITKELTEQGAMDTGKGGRTQAIAADKAKREVEKKVRDVQARLDADAEGLASFLNVASGRGELGRVGSAASPLLGGVFFSIRLNISRFQVARQTLWALADIAKNRGGASRVSKEIARSMAAFFGTNSLILTLAWLNGAKVELDPRSSEFGKMKIGDRVLVEGWAGFQPMARYMAQFIGTKWGSGEKKDIRTGEIIDANRAKTALRFFWSKLSPPAGLLVDWAVEKTFPGEPFPGDIEDELANRITPMWPKDIHDALEAEGLTPGTALGIGYAGLGGGMVTYGDRGGSERRYGSD